MKTRRIAVLAALALLARAGEPGDTGCPGAGHEPPETALGG